MSHASRPEVVARVAGLRELLTPLRRAGKRIGLVPTMGALHEGHLSLVRASKADCDLTVVSIYVNPTQFGPNEDLDQYPRTLEADLDALARCGVELVLVPPDEEVYPAGHATWVEVGGVAEPLEGACRPGHFRGVATVVLKLLGMVQPDAAYFGQKDYQQWLVIRRMVEDLNVPVEVRRCPLVRQPDGLAMSSRNAYLSSEGRRRALVLSRALELAKQQVAGGRRDARAIVEEMHRLVLAGGGAQIDYITVADPETLDPVDEIRGLVLAALAVKIEDTRLIDNCLLEP